MHKMDKLSAIRDEIQRDFSTKRAEHILGCEQTAAELASIYGVDEYNARLAALLHDITKEKNNAEQLKLCEKYGIIISNAELSVPVLLHAVTGAAVAADLYDVSKEVHDAIRYHTTGKEDMTTLEKIIYISDCIEPARHYDGVDEIRKLVRYDLNGAMRLALDRSIMYLLEKKKVIHIDTITARNWLYERTPNA